MSVRSTVQDKTTSIHEPDGQLIMCLVNTSGSRNPRKKRNKERNYWEEQAPAQDHHQIQEMADIKNPTSDWTNLETDLS